MITHATFLELWQAIPSHRVMPMYDKLVMGRDNMNYDVQPKTFLPGRFYYNIFCRKFGSKNIIWRLSFNDDSVHVFGDEQQINMDILFFKMKYQ